MRSKWFIKGLLCCAVLLARLLFLGVLILVPAVSGFAKMSEEPRSFSLRDKSLEQVERKILPKIDTRRLPAENEARGNNSQHQSDPAVEIGKVSQDSRGLEQMGYPGPTNEGLSETAVVCPAANGWWGLEIGAVGLIVLVDDMKTPPNDTCTGTLLNNTAHDFNRHYFLTANHCMLASGYTANSVVYWNYQEPKPPPPPSLPPPPPPPPFQPSGSRLCSHLDTNGHDLLPAYPGWPQQTTGFTVRARRATNDTDFMLLELNDPVPPLCDASHPPPYCVHYAGWDATGAALPLADNPQVVGIHHPQGDAKAISTANNVTNNNTLWCIPWWGTGTTEIGSSGSCLFDSKRRCIGQDHRAESSQSVFCRSGTTYGMLSASWLGSGLRDPNNTLCGRPSGCCNDCLSDWLDPTNGPGDCDQGDPKCDNGDPHITTADGVHYDFQGAGEYVSLRNPSGLEIQTRQAALPTAPPAADGYDGLATCVSLNTAVAARVGKHRVTYEPELRGEPDRRGFQPNPGGWPDPSDLQLRVDGGDPITLGPGGLDLSGGGRIAKTADAGGLEIDFPDHNALYVTPGFYFKPYLFLHVARLPVMDAADSAVPAAVSAPPESGLMGAIAPKSWLPALPDGTSVGPMPPLDERYRVLYGKFGEAWRVTDATSLFDYAPGTSTGTFTDRAWPPEHPPCTIPGIIPPEPASEPVAQEACRQITGKNTHHDCIFDVTTTGNTGFAKTYLAQQQLLLGATETAVEADKNPSKAGQSVTFTATVVSAASSSRAMTTGTVQFTLDGIDVGSPLTLDSNSNGRAVWSTSSLKAGDHKVAANYTPIPNSPYLASVSRYESHVVLETFDWYLWLAILLLFIIVVILLVWWYLRTI